MGKPFLLELSRVFVQPCDLLKLGVVIDSIMIIVRLLSPEPVGWLYHHQLYSGLGADIVMESISRIDRQVARFASSPWAAQECSPMVSTHLRVRGVRRVSHL